MGKPFFKYAYAGFHGCESVCNLEIHGSLVIATEREDNEGTSITNMAEQLATKVCQSFDITPGKLVWIEHYPEQPDIMYDENYSLVQFNLQGGTHFEKAFEFTTPRWVPIDKAVVEALRVDFEKGTDE